MDYLGGGDPDYLSDRQSYLSSGPPVAAPPPPLRAPAAYMAAAPMAAPPAAAGRGGLPTWAIVLMSIAAAVLLIVGAYIFWNRAMRPRASATTNKTSKGSIPIRPSEEEEPEDEPAAPQHTVQNRTTPKDSLFAPL